MLLSTSAYDLYDLTKVSLALKKPWVKHFLNLPIEYFFAFYYSQFSWDTIFLTVFPVFLILKIEGMRAVGKKKGHLKNQHDEKTKLKNFWQKNWKLRTRKELVSSS